MENPATISTLALALEEALGAPIVPSSARRLSVNFADGVRVAAEFGETGAAVLLATPVDGAHDGLPEPVLRGLLAANAYGGATAGGTLAVRNGGDTLEIADTVPAALGATAIAGLMINQAAAARTLAATIARDVANSLA